jgi:hypothetical protein
MDFLIPDSSGFVNRSNNYNSDNFNDSNMYDTPPRKITKRHTPPDIKYESRETKVFKKNSAFVKSAKYLNEELEGCQSQKLNFEYKRAEITLKGGVVKYIRDNLLSKSNEYMFSLTNDQNGEPLPRSEVKDSVKEGGESQHDPKNFVCTRLTGHTHPSRRRLFNPPSSSDIHSFIGSIRKTKCSLRKTKLSQGPNKYIILSHGHCVFTRNEIFTLSFDPVYLFVKNSTKDYLPEVFQNLDWLAGSTPETAQKPAIDWSKYQKHAKTIGVFVNKYNYPLHESDDVKIHVNVLDMLPGNMNTEADVI